MGLASSQARLLSLTSRQHTVEGRAQFLQAQKMRLANDSDAVYENYINALDATQLQTKTYDSNGKVHWLDASVNNLMRYEASDSTTGNVYYVQDVNDGKLFVPTKVFNAYNNSGNDVFNFLDQVGIEYTKNVHTNEYLDAQALLKSDLDKGWDVQPYDVAFMTEYSTLKANILNPAKSDAYVMGQNIHDCVSFMDYDETGVYYTSDTSKVDVLKADIEALRSTSYYHNPNVQTILDYCSSFNVTEIFDNTNKDNTQSINVYNNSNTRYLNYTKNGDDSSAEINDLMKLKMMLNGGTWDKVDTVILGLLFNQEITNDETTNGTIYSTDIQNTIDNYVGGTNINIGDALVQIGSDIMEAEYTKAKNTAETNLQTFLTNKDLTQEVIEQKLSNYQTYCNDLGNFNAQDNTTSTLYEDVVMGSYYENMYNAISSAGGCKEINETNAKSGSWVTNMVKNGQVVLATFDSDKKELDNISASSNVGLQEVTNDNAITEADTNYETDLEAISAKETKISTKLNQLEEERSAIQSEIETLKTIAKDNIDSTFKLFS